MTLAEEKHGTAGRITSAEQHTWSSSFRFRLTRPKSPSRNAAPTALPMRPWRSRCSSKRSANSTKRAIWCGALSTTPSGVSGRRPHRTICASHTRTRPTRSSTARRRRTMRPLSTKHTLLSEPSTSCGIALLERTRIRLPPVGSAPLHADRETGPSPTRSLPIVRARPYPHRQSADPPQLPRPALPALVAMPLRSPSQPDRSTRPPDPPASLSSGSQRLFRRNRSMPT